MTTEHSKLIQQLKEILKHLKHQFVGKDDIIDLMGICLVGRENIFLLGPPGTAKSAIVRALATSLEGKTFEYLLTRFTEPNELFGPFDIRKLREGELITNTEGMLPEAHLIFLDELLNANSAILNSLLMILNEKVFRRGRENRPLPAVMMVGASNQLPEDEALQALFDRFLIRVQCDYVDPSQLKQVLQAGWQLEQKNNRPPAGISAESIFSIQQLIGQVDLNDILPVYLDLIQMLRNAGVKVSDRRAVKLQRLIAASALLCQRTTAIVSDLWVLRYIWDTEEQQELIAGIVTHVIEKEKETEAVHHPRAFISSAPDADEIFREIQEMSDQWSDPNLDTMAKTVIKDRLRYLSGRCQWISNPLTRAYVQEPINSLWEKVLHSA